MAATIGLYFRGLTKPAANQLRTRLNEIAAGFGYTAAAGPTAGAGNAAAMLMAIDAGEIALVLLPDEHRHLAMKNLSHAAAEATTTNSSLHDALLAIHDAIADAVARERAADQRDLDMD